MAPKRAKKEKVKHKSDLVLKSAVKDPTLKIQPNTSSHPDGFQDEEATCRAKFLQFLYNKEKNTYCDRTCRSWLYIVLYSIFYLLFLATYSMMVLFITLMVLKNTANYKTQDHVALLTYSENGVGLTATPTAEGSYPLIWYRIDDSKSYQKYVSALERLLESRRVANVDFSSLGPCSKAPFGYGSKPCIIIRINHLLHWSGKPLTQNSSLISRVPKEVKEWLGSSSKLWLHCEGYHSYDKEHIGKINYYPNPPGFDPKLYPLDVRNKSPLVALQIKNFTVGVTLVVQCNLWYENGPSSVDFMLYVEPQERVHTNVNNSES